MRSLFVDLWQFDGALFEPSVPQRQSTGFPSEGFDAVSLPVDKQEQRSVGDAVSQRGRDDARDSVETFFGRL